MSVRRAMMLAGGYIAACAVASIILVAALMIALRDPGPPRFDIGFVVDVVPIGVVMAGVIAALALVPAAIAAYISQRASLHSALYFALAGVVVAIAAFGLYLVLGAWNESLSTLVARAALLRELACVLGIMALAGFCAGLVFWAIAGRTYPSERS